jgi:hypothetical protein
VCVEALRATFNDPQRLHDEGEKEVRSRKEKWVRSKHLTLARDSQRREITSLRRALPSVDPQKILQKSGKEIRGRSAALGRARGKRPAR